MNMYTRLRQTIIPERVRLAFSYRKRQGHWPDLNAPKRFSEKIQIAKMAWRSPLMVTLADKVEAKAYVGGLLGAEWITPNLWSGEVLPPRRERDWPVPFVLKANNGSGGHMFVRNAAALDWQRIEERVAHGARDTHGSGWGEWVYTQIRPQWLVEPLLDGGGVPPADFKLFVFNQRVEFIQVHYDRHGNYIAPVYDRNWNKQPFGLHGPHKGTSFPRPASLEAMIAGAEQIARGFPFARVDLYEIDGRPRFGEVTFYPGSGHSVFDPVEVDLAYGALWTDLDLDAYRARMAPDLLGA